MLFAEAWDAIYTYLLSWECGRTGAWIACMRACYIRLRSGWGSDGNVYNVLRGLRGAYIMMSGSAVPGAARVRVSAGECRTRAPRAHAYNKNMNAELRTRAAGWPRAPSSICAGRPQQDLVGERGSCARPRSACSAGWALRGKLHAPSADTTRLCRSSL